MNFQTWPILSDLLAIDLDDSPIGPIALRSWSGYAQVPAGGSAIVLPVASTLIAWPEPFVGFLDARMGVGCYAQVPGGARLLAGAGLIIHTPAYVGLPQIGGPAEATGRLRYIDGCSDTLLICPATLGDPCLNLLHLPPHIHQTAHTHPSDRIGLILRGSGVCTTPEEGDTALVSGLFWRIPANGIHSFHTNDESLDVFAWHPDSDFGPSHDAHPMLNRTIVGGVSANAPANQAIRTAS